MTLLDRMLDRWRLAVRAEDFAPGPAIIQVADDEIMPWSLRDVESYSAIQALLDPPPEDVILSGKIVEHPADGLEA